jgi:hypothetical protein
MEIIKTVFITNVKSITLSRVYFDEYILWADLSAGYPFSQLMTENSLKNKVLSRVCGGALFYFSGSGD